MVPRRLPVHVLGAFLAALLISGCSGDKVEQARRLIDTQPEKALELLGQAAGENGETFDSLIYTGLTLEKMGRDSDAIAAYEKALALDGATARQEPVPERLLALYAKVHGQTQDRAAKVDIAGKAAALEKSLKVAKPWASTYLLESISTDMAAAGAAGDEATVRKLVGQGMDLAVPTDAKNKFGEAATAAMRSAFVASAEKKFMESLAAPLAEKGVFIADGARIVFSNEFVIPPAKTGPDFDPANPAFLANVRKNACVPLHSGINETVVLAGDALGLKNVDADGMKVVFEDLYRNNAKAGFKAFGGDKRPPNGQTYLCEINVPLRDFLAAIFVFAG